MNIQRMAGPALWLAALGCSLAVAQTSDPEPAVRTSEPPPPATANPAPADPAATAAAAASRAPRHDASHNAAAPVVPLEKAAARGAAKATDRVQLDTTQISGNRELPKVLYVLPWHKSDLGDFAGRPPNSLLDEALAPVDRDVFRRQNRYFAALAAGDGAANPRQPAADAESVPFKAKDEK
jgi:hypothetical protein